MARRSGSATSTTTTSRRRSPSSSATAACHCERARQLEGPRWRPLPELEVELPRRATVVLEAASGDFEADGLIGDQRYRTASGDVRLRDVAGRISVDAVSGDVQRGRRRNDPRGPDRVGRCRREGRDAHLARGQRRPAATSGSPGISAVRARSASSPSAAMRSWRPPATSRIEMATLSGDLHSEVGGQQESRRGRRSLSVGSGGPTVNVRSLSGDLSVVRPVRAADTGRAPTATAAVPPPAPPMPSSRPRRHPAATAPVADDPRPRPPTAPSPRRTTRLDCASCDRSSTARSMSRKPAAGSRRSRVARRIRPRTPTRVSIVEPPDA